MKTRDLNNVELQKENLRDKIKELFEEACNPDVKCCLFRSCVYHKRCLRHDEIDGKRRGMKNLLKNLREHIRKGKGKEKISPYNDGNTLWERAAWLLGQDIFEHELIKGCKWAKVAISRCTTLNQIAEILDRRHKEVHNKSLIWHYSRYAKKSKS